MQVEWHGQSAFTLTGSAGRVALDPFGDMSAARKRGIVFDYPPIEVDGVDLLLITHEHGDHNAVEAIGGEPAVLRSTAGRLESPLGEVLAVASEHDRSAGTERGPNTIFVFELDGLRIAHFGDFGQSELRPEQAVAIGKVDLLFIPVGGGPTIAGDAAAAIAARLSARWIVPMHYRTGKADFLPADEQELIGRMPKALRLETPAFDSADLADDGGPIVIVPAVP